MIENLNWRYATKKFDKTKKIPQQEFNEIIESIRLSPSSFGLQPYKFLIIESEEVRKKLKPASWDQPQITDASHLIVFCTKTSIDKEYINEHLELLKRERNMSDEAVQWYSDRIMGFVNPLSDADLHNWMSRQTYIALGNLLTCCANKKIDACPIEGFEKDKYDSILNLKDKGLTTSVVTAVGYRAEDDAYQFVKKVRKSSDYLFEYI